MKEVVGITGGMGEGKQKEEGGQRMRILQEKHLAGTPIRYWIGGNPEAETIVFLHSAFSDHHCFDEQVDALADDYQVIVPDLIGHGKSTDGKASDGIDKTAYFLHCILSELSIARVHLAGVSIGSLFAQDFANRYPGMVLSLCCVGGYDINNFDPKMQRENSAGQARLILRAVFSVKWFAEGNRRVSAFTPEGQEKYYQMNLGFKRRSLRFFAGLNKIINKQETLPRDYPLMIACGAKDVPLAVKASLLWHEKEPNSRLVIFDQAGHHANLDVPERFNATFKEFLEGTSKRAD